MEKKSKLIKSITIVNAHWNNRGDEAALLAVLEGLLKSYQKSKITILIKDGKSVEQFPEMERVNYFPAKFNAKVWDIWLTTLSRGFWGVNKTLKKTVQTIKKSDLIIYSPGGSVINKRFFWRKQMEYLVPFICAKFYCIPMLIAAPSVGPFDTSKPNRILKWLLKTPQIFCVREQISKKYLEEIGITENVFVTIDSAFYTKINFDANAKKLATYSELANFLDSYDKVIGITITDFKWHVIYNKDKELSKRIDNSFTKFIRKLNDRGYGVLFIPQLFGNQNDYHYMNQFSGNNTLIMDDTKDSFFQQYIISKLYAVVGMRYHSNIFAAKMSIPFIAIVYEEKMTGFIQSAHLDQYSIMLDEVSFEKLNNKFSELETNYHTIINTLQNKQREWKECATKTINMLSSEKR